VAALHSGASPLIAHLAAVYTIALGVGATFVGAQLAPKMRDIMKHHDGPSMTANSEAESVAAPRGQLENA
jgi:hypothetical protein